MPEQKSTRYCPYCGYETPHVWSEIEGKWYCDDPDHPEYESDSSMDLGGTGHGDISYSDADPGL